ncbi:hypothetical protein [Thalassobacillus sp. C254]|uniref:hypothetical protein n=1 Tax=Thalassobacillus sp. C254 TaxID=1225341 RepID=UPI0006D108BB|nr:hypothetical protein [Thalassobacillus sp. C254]
MSGEISKLAKKLQIKPGYKVALINAPSHISGLLHPLPEDVEISAALTEEYDIIHLFAGWKQEVDELLPLCKDHLKGKRIVWVSYPKKASKVDTDLTRDKDGRLRERAYERSLSSVCG